MNNFKVLFHLDSLVEKVKTFFLKNIQLSGIILIVLISMPLFWHLGKLPIRLWDESRNVANALEMTNNNDYIVTHFKGEPDMWNTKPPLLIWLQVISMKIFGFSEVAVRLPSALAAFFTILMLFIFGKRFLKSEWLGFSAAMILVTSSGFVNIHISRTGDYDALLILFTTLSLVSFYVFSEGNKTKYLYAFFIFTAMAVLTKSISGLLFLPGILIYSIFTKQTIPLLRNRHFYFGLSAFLFIVVGYYWLREINNPGFLEAVQENEIGGRYLTEIESHKGPFWFYYTNLISTSFHSWYLLLPCGFLAGIYSAEKRIRRLTLYLLILIVTFFLIISSAKTKIYWYDAPAFPLYSLLVAIFFQQVIYFLNNLDIRKQNLKKNIIPYLFIFMILITPYQNIVNTTYLPVEAEDAVEYYEISYFLRDAKKGKFDLNNHQLLYSGYDAPTKLYIRALQEKGVNINYGEMNQLCENSLVIVCQDNVRQFVEEHYKCEITSSRKNVLIYRIYGPKSDS